MRAAVWILSIVALCCCVTLKCIYDEYPCNQRLQYAGFVLQESCSKVGADYFQKGCHQDQLSFALKIFCVLFLNMPMALSAEVLQKMCLTSMNYSPLMHKSKIRTIRFNSEQFVTMNPFQLCTVCYDVHETWGPCARALQCCERSLRRDKLAWPLRWSNTFPIRNHVDDSFTS